MTQVVNAIYEDGALRPLDPVHLEEHQHVRVTVETLDGDASNDRGTELQRLLHRLEKSTFSYCGSLPKRYELHER